LLYSGYPGNAGSEFANPNGVVAVSPRVRDGIGVSRIAIGVLGCFRRETPAATPLGLRGSSLLFPKVAEYGNLGLWDATPLELRETIVVFPSNPKWVAPQSQT